MKTLRGVQWCSRQPRGDENDGKSTLEYWAAMTGIKQEHTAVQYTGCTHTPILRPFFQDYPGEPVPEETEDKQRQSHWPSGWAPLHPD